MKNAIKTLFCLSLFSLVSAAENPTQSPFVTRGRALGDTGVQRAESTPKLQRANTIKVKLPITEKKKEAHYISPRDIYGSNPVLARDLPKTTGENK